jgi:hypothetical protein
MFVLIIRNGQVCIINALKAQINPVICAESRPGDDPCEGLGVSGAGR